MGIQYSVTETQSHTHKRFLFILSQRSRENKKHKRKIMKEKGAQASTTNENVAGSKEVHPGQV